MSLGPPFDESGERLRLAAGAAATVTLVAAVGIALLASDRTIGDTMTFHVLFRSPGALRTGSHVRMAGTQIGEIVAIRRTGWFSSPSEEERRTAPRVEVEVRALRSWQKHLHRNSTFFAHTPNVLTEAILEVGPPAGGAEPGRVIEEGEHVRGVDPAEIDLLLAKILTSLIGIREVSRELSAEWRELRGAFVQVQESLGALTGTREYTSTLVQGDLALSRLRRLRGTLAEVGAVPRLRGMWRDISRALDETAPELSRLAAQLRALDDQLSGVLDTFGPRQRAQLDEGVRLFREVLADAERMGQDIAWLLAYVETGRGTVGGFQKDIQIFDELKETHRILKRRSWRLLIKSKDPGQRHLR